MLMKERRYDCRGCDCCSFVVLKSRVYRRHRRRGDAYNVVGDRMPMSKQWFSFHGIRLSIFKDYVVYEFKVKSPLMWKVKNGWLYYRVDKRCRYLLPNHKCAIYVRRPDVCRLAECPRIDDEKLDIHYGVWDIAPDEFGMGAGAV